MGTPARHPSREECPAIFEPLAAGQTGIAWTHTSGRSPGFYLPETTGHGAAFLDYDSDGRMEIYLVNSGTCDFFTPKTPLRNALYRNNRDGTSLISRRRQASLARATAWASRSVTITTTDSRTSSSPGTTGASFTATMATEPSRTSPKRLVLRSPAGLRAPSGSTTTTMDGSTSLSAASLSSIRRQTNSAATQPAESASTASPMSIRAAAAYSSTTMAMERSPTSLRRQASPPPLERRGVSSQPTSTTMAGWTSS